MIFLVNIYENADGWSLCLKLCILNEYGLSFSIMDYSIIHWLYSAGCIRTCVSYNGIASGLSLGEALLYTTWEIIIKLTGDYPNVGMVMGMGMESDGRLGWGMQPSINNRGFSCGYSMIFTRFFVVDLPFISVFLMFFT